MKGAFVSLTIFCLAVVASSAPSSLPGIRPKRVSDQRLAELQTLSALARVRNPGGLYLPLGLGDMDIHQIGRKRRSSMESVNDYLSRHEDSESPLKTGPSSQFGGAPYLVDSFPWGSWRENRKEAEPTRRDGSLSMMADGGNFF